MSISALRRSLLCLTLLIACPGMAAEQGRSAIFPLNDEQAAVAKAYIAQLNIASVFGKEIATKI